MNLRCYVYNEDGFYDFDELVELYNKGELRKHYKVSILNANDGDSLLEERINIGQAINTYMNYE